MEISGIDVLCERYLSNLSNVLLACCSSSTTGIGHSVVELTPETRMSGSISSMSSIVWSGVMPKQHGMPELLGCGCLQHLEIFSVEKEAARLTRHAQHTHSPEHVRYPTDTSGVTPPDRSRAYATGNIVRSQAKYLDLSNDFVYPSARCISVLTK